jgi:hypothetical protein
MSDTKHHVHTSEPVEPDSVSFSGLGWFAVILTLTVLVSQVIVWGLFEWYAYRMRTTEAPRAPMAAAPVAPTIDGGQVMGGLEAAQAPRLLVNEPANLRQFMDAQRSALHAYGWADQAQGTVRLPIDRAKDLVLERGLPFRPGPTRPVETGQATAPPTTAGAAEPAGAAAAPAAAH